MRGEAMRTITLIPGDGVGQEVVPAARLVLEAVLSDARYVSAEAGWECFLRRGTSLPDATLQAVLAADATLFGATQSPSTLVEGYFSPILALRRKLDLYSNLRPVTALAPSARRVDLLIVRENTEGLYSGRERSDGDTAIAERVITRRASERIARSAFEQARRRAALGPAPSRRARVTVVHKANVLKLSDGLFREACLGVAAHYPDVETEERLVDTAAMQLVSNPERFDVLVTTNLFGDILSDLAAGLAGGLGVAPSANVGDGRAAVFEPVHGSAPDIAGKGIANPIGAILSAAMLLDHLQENEGARRIRGAVAASAAAGISTPDLGGSARSQEVVEAILAELQASRGKRMSTQGELRI
jgi:homoisocitrate dehydrogenase